MYKMDREILNLDQNFSLKLPQNFSLSESSKMTPEFIYEFKIQVKIKNFRMTMSVEHEKSMPLTVGHID